MKKILFLVFGIVMVWYMGGCGGGTSPDAGLPQGSSIPIVSGVYNCTTGCTSPCAFGPIHVSQTGSNIIVQSDVSVCNGTIQSSGNFSGNCDGAAVNTDGTCSGTIAGNVASLNCVLGGFTCQRAAYTKSSSAALELGSEDSEETDENNEN